jgi:hypothetical protein
MFELPTSKVIVFLHFETFHAFVINLFNLTFTHLYMHDMYWLNDEIFTRIFFLQIGQLFIIYLYPTNIFFKEPTFFSIRKIMPKREIKIYSLKWSDFLRGSIARNQEKISKHHHILAPHLKEGK